MVRQKNKKSRNQMPSIQPVTEKNEFKTLEPGKEHHTLKLEMFFQPRFFSIYDWSVFLYAGISRGFGFLEFKSVSEAQDWMERHRVC